MKQLLGTACQVLAVSIGLWATTPSPAVGAEEGVANVRAEELSMWFWPEEAEGQPKQVRGFVRVSYDLNGVGTYGVSLHLYSVDHTTGEVVEEPRPQRTFGDIGQEVSPGADKQIGWNALEERPDLWDHKDYLFVVRAVRHQTKWLRLVGMTAVGAGAVVAGSQLWWQDSDDTGTIVIDVPDPE